MRHEWRSSRVGVSTSSRLFDANDLRFQPLLLQFDLQTVGLDTGRERPQTHPVHGSPRLFTLGDFGGLTHHGQLGSLRFSIFVARESPGLDKVDERFCSRCGGPRRRFRGLRWRLARGPWFDNNLATLEITEAGLRLWWATGDVEGDDHAHPRLRTVSEVTVP